MYFVLIWFCKHEILVLSQMKTFSHQNQIMPYKSSTTHGPSLSLLNTSALQWEQHQGTKVHLIFNVFVFYLHASFSPRTITTSWQEICWQVQYCKSLHEWLCWYTFLQHPNNIIIIKACQKILQEVSYHDITYFTALSMVTEPQVQHHLLHQARATSSRIGMYITIL